MVFRSLAASPHAIDDESRETGGCCGGRCGYEVRDRAA